MTDEQRAPSVERPGLSLEDRSASAAERHEHGANVMRMRLAMAFGLFTWTTFGIFDWLGARYIYPVDPLRLLAVRALVLPLQVFFCWRMWRVPAPSPAFLRAIDLAAFSSTSAALGFMLADFGGIGGPYHQGAYIVIMCRGAFLMQPWRQGWLPNLVIVVAHFAALLLAVPSHPALAAQLASTSGQLMLVGTFSSLLFAAALMVLASHSAWALRRRVFEARQLGRYRLDAPIGEGGHGQVWRAYHPGLRSQVAVKILKGDHASDSRQVARFEREVRATFALSHPNTVRVFDYGVSEDGVCYFAMELLTGCTLAELVAREGPLPPARALHLVVQAADALAEAHRAGIVHRDVKPENLFVTSVGGASDFVKVLDFGIAQLAQGTMEPQLTRTGAVVGTPGYMAPEAVLGGPVDARADVYALGAVLYFALTGAPPFVGDGAESVLRAQARDVPRPLRELRGAELPHDLESVTLRCLARWPLQRFCDGAELGAALRACAAANTWAPAPSASGSEAPSSLEARTRTLT